jgi:hypothetical protein
VTEYEKPDDPGDLEEEVDESLEEDGVEKIEFPLEGTDPPGPEVEDRQLTAHFKLSEFHCRDGTPVPKNTIDGLIALCTKVLEPMRDKFGVCTVSSGFRSKRHNDAVGGATSSYHRYELRPGKAASDVKFRNGTPATWFAEADRILGSRGGAGRYKTFLHVDNRDGRWRQP